MLTWTRECFKSRFISFSLLLLLPYPLKPNHHHIYSFTHTHTHSLSLSLSLSLSHSLIISVSTAADPDLLLASVTTFAPATVANLGPGFDFLGCAINGLGDVSLAVDPKVHPRDIAIAIADITSDNAAKLGRDPLWNCAGISAIEVMKALGVHPVGLSRKACLLATASAPPPPRPSWR